MSNNLDVVICGAGAAGLTLAIELARRGVAFRLLEQRDRPFHGSRGKGIQPRSQEVFEDMGIVNQLFAAGGDYPVSRSHHADGTHTDTVMVEALPATPAEPYRRPLMVPQFLTECVMRGRLAALGHRVDFGHALIGGGVASHTRRTLSAAVDGAAVPDRVRDARPPRGAGAPGRLRACTDRFRAGRRWRDPASCHLSGRADAPHTLSDRR